MTKHELLDILNDCAKLNGSDAKTGHSNADDALIDYLDDPEICTAYNLVTKWYG